jgi:hypothetical protein
MQSTHSRATGAARLVLAVWLIYSGVRTLADPQHEAGPLPVLLPIAGLYFALGVFLLTGFMSRVAGLILLGLGAWEWFNLAAGIVPAILALSGLYFMLRGGGAWAMDIYVQKVQDRARRKAAAAVNAPQSS